MTTFDDENDFFISPLNDAVFAQVFGSQQNIGNTRGFLKRLLDIPADDYDQLTVESPDLKRLSTQGKKGIVDLKLTTKSGRIIHIELQVTKEADFRSRIMYYGGRLIGEQLHQGDRYSQLNQVISIAICNHVLIEGEESYINRFELRNEKGRTFTDLLKVIILELPKIPKEMDGTLWPWLQYFKCRKREDFEMLAENYPEVEEAVNGVRYMTLREQLPYILLDMQINEMDELTRNDRLRREGQTAEKLEIARKMKERGQPLAEIAEITDLPIETIEQL